MAINFDFVVDKQKIFDLIIDSFPRIVTLIFETHDRLRLNYDRHIAHVFSFVDIDIIFNWDIVKAVILWMFMFPSNAAQNLRLYFTISSRIYQTVTIHMELITKFPTKLRDKGLHLRTAQTLRLFPNAIVGVFRLLREFDPLTLDECENNYNNLGDMDFYEIP